MKENITRFLKPCKSCGEPTANFDGYCDMCEPPEQEDSHDTTKPELQP